MVVKVLEGITAGILVGSAVAGLLVDDVRRQQPRVTSEEKDS